MASRNIEDAVLQIQLAFKAACNEWRAAHADRPQPFVTCTYRSREEQDTLYAQGRTTPGKRVTNAKAGESKHNFFPSQAIDIAFKAYNGELDWSDSLFRDFAVLMKKYGTQWGGDWHSFKDTPHFEI